MRKLATASFSFSAAIIVSRYLLPYNWLPVCCAIAAAASFTGLLMHGYMRMRVIISLLALAAGFIWSWTYTAVFVMPSGRLNAQTETVAAVIKDYPSATARGYRVDGVVRPESGPAVGARLYYYHETRLKPGDTVEFTARFLRTDGMSDGERIDALSSRGAFLAGYISGDIKVTGSGGRFAGFPQRLAQAVAGMTEKLYDSDTAPFMQALLVNNRDKLNGDTALMSALSAAGITHVVSVSGMHVSFLMGFLAVIIKNKRLFALIGIPVLLIFMAMTGFTPSMVRAGVMQVFLICAPIFRRERDSITSLSASLFVLLAINPYSSASVGLQLSFSATLGIILFTGRIDAAVTDTLREQRCFKHKWSKAIARFITTSLATTIGALVFTLPLSAIHFGYVSLVAPLTNLLTLWAVSLAFPIGIVACALGFIYMPIASIAAYPVALAVKYIIFVVRMLAALPYSTVYASNAHIIFWLAYVYIMFITLPLMKARVRQYILPVCTAVVALLAVLLLAPLFPGPGDSAVTVLDVGQGLSVVMMSGEHAAIVDCGSSSGENAGAIAHEFLTNRGVTSVDILVLTHFHADHANGVEFILSRMHVSALAIPDPEGSFLADDIIQLARKRGTDIIYVTQETGLSFGSLELTLYPPVGYGDENERGLTILTSGDISALITGDMNSSGERSLLRSAAVPDIDVLVVGHHGSKYSTSEELLKAVTPEIAVISVGYNSYGHPAAETLERLERFHIMVFRTDEMGNVTVGGR